MKITIKNDVFNIFKRIKQINNNYFIIFNTNKNKYEIYEKDYLLFTIPFDYLDVRTIDYVLKMLKTSNEEILKEIEQHNNRLEKNETEKLIVSSLDCAERILKRS